MDNDAAGRNVLVFIEFNWPQKVLFFCEEYVDLKFGMTIEGDRFCVLMGVRELSFSGEQWRGLKESSVVRVRTSSLLSCRSVSVN